MPAVILSDFHSGFLNEEYAVFMLRQIGAVASIGRAEDHGIDGVVTLLPKANDLLHASDTFQIQLKSKSVRQIEYGGEGEDHVRGEVDWLRSLQTPLFFGSVSRIENGEPGRLRIYSAQNLLGALTMNPKLSRIGVCLDKDKASPSESEESVFMNTARDGYLGQGLSQAEAQTKAEQAYGEFLLNMGRSVWWLGLPIVEYDQVEISEPDFREQIILIVQAWVRIALDNIRQAPLGMFDFAKWKTNEHPAISHTNLHPREPSDDEVKLIVRHAARSLLPLCLERLYHGKESDIDSIKRLLSGLKEDGFPVEIRNDLIDENWRRLAKKREEYRKSRVGTQ